MNFIEKAYKALLPDVASFMSLKDYLRSGNLGDITILEQSSYIGRGSRLCNVLASTNVINAGEPVVRTIGNSTVITGSTNLILVNYATPLAGTALVGIAMTTSTNTSTTAGTVDVLPVSSETTYLINANSTTLFNTQAKYNNLVGARVLIDLTAGAFTLLATDSASNGCIIMPLDIVRYPGKVAFAFRRSLSDLA